MKKLTFLIIAALALMFSSCEKAQTQSTEIHPEGFNKTVLPSHTYNLTQGWNDISFYLQGESDDIADILAPIEGKVVVCKGLVKVYWPSEGINQIGEIDYAEGFIINVSEDCSFTHFGGPVTDEIVLHEGWNLVGVPYDAPQQVGALYPISANSQNNIVKEAIGSLVYWPYYGIDQIVNAQPGGSYKVYVE